MSENKNPFSNSKPWMMKESPEPIPVNKETYDNICDKISDALDGEPLNESIVALLSILNTCLVHQKTGEITLDMTIRMLKQLNQRSRN